MHSSTFRPIRDEDRLRAALHNDREIMLTRLALGRSCIRRRANGQARLQCERMRAGKESYPWQNEHRPSPTPASSSPIPSSCSAAASANVLHRDGRLAIVGEVACLSDLPQACVELTPHVVFLGCSSEGVEGAGGAGLAALRRAMEPDPFVHVVVLMEHGSAAGVLEAVQAGASGVLLRDASGTALLDAARDVIGGGAALDPRLARTLFEDLGVRETSQVVEIGPGTLGASTLRLLSHREQEVMRALAQGLRNKEIAAALGVSVGTVKTHLRHIFRKLHVADRTAAVLTALQVRLRDAA